MTSPDFEAARAAFFAALAHQQAGELARAEQLYRESLRLLPGRVSTLVNLAATQAALGRPEEALRTANAALDIEPTSVDALLHHSTSLSRLGRLPEAVAGFDRLLALEEGHAVAWTFKGEALRELGRVEESASAYRRALALGADPELNGYYLAAVAGAAPPPAPPAAYVEALFDSYADDFEQHLVEGLQYDGHQRLVDGLAALNRGPFESALDIGCGTGLCAPLLRPLCRRLVGVDLSGRMLDKAQSRGLYDRLERADAVDYLRTTEERHDLFVAADVFIYVGALEPLFAAARAAMARGVFCFSVEVPGAGEEGFRLETSLRYSHGRGYVTDTAARHGFELLAMRSSQVRRDQGVGVDGLYVYLGA